MNAAALLPTLVATVKSLPAFVASKLAPTPTLPRFEIVRAADPYSRGYYVLDRELGREYPVAHGRREAEVLLDVIEDDPDFASAVLNYFPLGSFTKETR